jgi:hypothetical protein
MIEALEHQLDVDEPPGALPSKAETESKAPSKPLTQPD